MILNNILIVYGDSCQNSSIANKAILKILSEELPEA